MIKNLNEIWVRCAAKRNNKQTNNNNKHTDFNAKTKSLQYRYTKKFGYNYCLKNLPNCFVIVIILKSLVFFLCFPYNIRCHYDKKLNIKKETI